MTQLKNHCWVCPICNQSFRTRNELKIHRKSENHYLNRPEFSHLQREDYICPYCNKEMINSTKSAANLHINYCKENPNKKIKKGYKLSESQKKNLSEVMKKKHSLGIAPTFPIRKKGSQSYPEKWFTSVIENRFNDKDYVTELHVGKWFLDFAWKEKMRYIEIDGEQHERFEERKKSDIEKDNYMKSIGWEVLRLPWKYISNNKEDAILKAINFIDNGEKSEITWVDYRILEIAEKEKRKVDRQKYWEDEWNKRKELLENSGVDILKFGWITKVSEITGLSSHQIKDTVSHFNMNVYKLDRAIY